MFAFKKYASFSLYYGHLRITSIKLEIFTLFPNNLIFVDSSLLYLNSIDSLIIEELSSLEITDTFLVFSPRVSLLELECVKTFL